MMGKKRARKSESYRRGGKKRRIKDKFLIVCQGKETEKNYFKALGQDFRISGLEIRVESKDPGRVVEYACNKRCSSGSPYNDIWCVFDKDQFTDENFNDAIRTAEEKNIGVAYSNSCFELWLYLHFNNCESPLSFKEYEEKLNEHFEKHLSKRYKKTDKDIYENLKNKKKAAVARAKKLYTATNRHNPAKANPSTTVHHLIRGLEKKSQVPE